MPIRRIVSVLLLSLVTSCKEATSPGSVAAGIRLLAGAGQADTIDAVLSRALMVEVRDTLGGLAAGEVVRFEALPDTLALARVSVAPLAAQSFSSFVADTTDGQGRAGVLIRLGQRPGTARLQITVPALGLVNMAAFTVLVGGAAAVSLQPRDTTIVLGASFQLRALVVDRYSNPRGDQVTYLALDASARVNSDGLVTAQADGLGRIVASAAGVSPETTSVSILPLGTIAASITGGVLVANLDGSGYKVLPVATADYQGRYPSWLSSTGIAAMDGRYYADLLRVNTDGSVSYLVPTADSVVLEVWPQASRDGAWIYFGGLVPGYSTSGISIWRVQPDGAGIERVSPPNSDFEGDTYPSPSPDGTRVATASTRSGGFSLAIINVTTRQLAPLGVPGIAPRWAPAGDSIAYLGGPGLSEIWLVNANGGGSRRVSPSGRQYAPGIDWSPDRRWIVARSQVGLELVHTATGLVVPLSGLPADASQPAWKP